MGLPERGRTMPIQKFMEGMDAWTLFRYADGGYWIYGDNSNNQNEGESVPEFQKTNNGCP